MKTLKHAVAVLCLAPAFAFGAGFAIADQSARALGEGGAGTASTVGAANVYYNPGNMAFDEGVAAEASGMVIAPQFSYSQSYQASNATSINPEVFVLPTVFAEAHILPRVSVGLGGFSNYGLGLAWPTGFAGRFDTTATNITTYTINPTVSVKLSDNFGLGIGVDIVRATVELSQALNFLDSEGSLHLGGGTWGIGFNAAVGSKWLDDTLKVGLAWRSFVPLTFKGRADFAASREFQSTLADQAVSTSFSLPNQFALGGAYKVNKELSLTLDLTYTTWSSFSNLSLSFDNPQLNQTLSKSWHNTLAVRIGGEYTVTDQVFIRAGLGYDPSPSPSYTLSASLPDSDRLLGTVGLGLKFGAFGADLGYEYVAPQTRAAGQGAPTYPAVYSGSAHVVGLSLNLHI